MINDTDIAWLAGVFDGEGCVYVQRVKRVSKKRGERLVPTIQLTIANTSASLVRRVVSIMRTLGVVPNVNVDPDCGTRPIAYVKVCRKHDALVVARALLPHVTAKKDEFAMAIWYLERACRSRQHIATDQDLEVLDAITAVKHGGTITDEISNLIH